MKEFLNDFMAKNRDLDIYPKDILAPLFYNTIQFIYKNFDKNVFVLSRVINAALFDAIMVGVAKRLIKGDITERAYLNEKYQSLLSDEDFKLSCMSGTSDEKPVETRINMAIRAFDDVE